MIELREGCAADRDAILALRARCFPEDDPEKLDPRFWDWEFGNGGRFFVAADEERVAAHIGFVPQTYVVTNETMPAMLAVDAMTDPDYRRQHLFSRVVECARDALRSSIRVSGAFQIREAVLPGMTRNGWAPLLRAPVFVLPFRFLGAPVPRFLGPTRPRNRANAESVASIATEFLARAAAHASRTAELMRWRFFENPLWQYDIDATSDAYVVSRRTKLRGVDSIAIADAGWRAGAERHGRALLRQVLARGREEGADVAAVLITLGHPALPAFVRAGFLPTPHRFRFLVNDFGASLPRGRWALTWADTDHL